jgi:hypothetical protein
MWVDSYSSYLFWDKIFNFYHLLCDFSRIVGLRDRLRCPWCHKVGTWKPHGGWLDTSDTAGKRRWLCKWCGFFWSKDKIGFAKINSERGVWDLKGDGPTPEQRLGKEVDPWRG